jgi:hypothetical protein
MGAPPAGACPIGIVIGACPNTTLDIANIIAALIVQTRRIALSSNISTSLSAPRFRHKPFTAFYFESAAQ